MDRTVLPREDKAPVLRYPGRRILSFLSLGALLLLWPCLVLANWSPLIGRLVEEGFDETAVRALFSRPEVRFESSPMSSKLEELLKKASWKKTDLPAYNPKIVYRGFLREPVIARARSYLRENAQILENIKNEYCVPKEIVVSILLVETRLGDFVGGKWAFNALASMALCTDLETIRPYLPRKLIGPGNDGLARTLCREKADWAYAELKALIVYADGNGFDPLSLPGSIYGAIGLCQFLPSNSLTYGVDADQDGRINLFNKTDALHSIASYLRGHGWKCTMDQASQHRAILDYNRSSVYANTVLAVAEKLGAKPRINR